MKEYIRKALSEIKTGDVILRNSDYDDIEVEVFNKEMFDSQQQSYGIRCFGFGSYRGGCNYSLNSADKYMCNFLDDEDSAIVCEAYKKFLMEEEELWKEILEVHCEPLYYVSDTELNVKLDYGDVLLYKDLKYRYKSFEFLELNKGTYQRTIANSIDQEEQFYEWLTSAKDKKMRVVFHGKKIIVAPEYCQYQRSPDSLIITYISAHEDCLYKVNIDMCELSERIGKINNELYRVVRSVFEKYDTVKKSGTNKDWNGNIINSF